jgi:hypothetical protein
MFEIYIVQVVVADGWGEDYFYCFHKMKNAREKIAELAKDYELMVYNPDFAARYGDFDRKHTVKEVKLSEEMFED